MKTYWDLASRMKIVGVVLGLYTVVLLGFLAAVGSEKNMAIVVLLFGGASLLGIGVFIHCFVVRPYRKTVGLLQEFNRGAVMEELFSMLYPFCQEFAWSLEKLHQLLDTKEMLKLSVDQSRYLALQNQINPHFLYNTLDVIRGDALMLGMREVAKTTEALSTFFGYSISNLDKYATLAEELENIKDYMIIQQYRFGDALKLEVDNKDEDRKAYHYYMPRMTLQPLVENAIYHGLEGKTGLGTVTIRIHTSQSGLFINVTDNGVGMEQHIVDRLNAAMHRAESGHMGANQSRGGIAMKNVNSRVRLLFGEQYGLHIFSEKGLGTDIRISLPIIEKDALER